MQLFELSLMSLLLKLLCSSVLNFSLLIGLLSLELVKRCGPILSLLLKIAHPLHFQLFLLSEALVLPSLCLFSFQSSPLMISNLLVKMSLSLPCGRFLRKCILVGNPDLVVNDLDASGFLLLDLDVLQSDLLNVGLQLSLL